MREINLSPSSRAIESAIGPGAAVFGRLCRAYRLESRFIGACPLCYWSFRSTLVIIGKRPTTDRPGSTLLRRSRPSGKFASHDLASRELHHCHCRAARTSLSTMAARWVGATVLSLAPSHGVDSYMPQTTTVHRSTPRPRGRGIVMDMGTAVAGSNPNAVESGATPAGNSITDRHVEVRKRGY